MERSIEALQEKLGYQFHNPELLLRALTHRSWASEHGSAHPENSDNEQFEFLGDSILGFVVSESLVLKHPAATEGRLSKWKAHLVSAKHLHYRALDLGLGDHLRLGKGEEKNGGRKRKTLLVNALEAVIAAIHMDGGVAAASSFVEEHILPVLETPDHVKSIDLADHKSLLQEKAQALRLPVPRYEVVETTGPEHGRVFTVEAKIGEHLSSRATGSSKKEAGQHAARLLISQIESR